MAPCTFKNAIRRREGFNLNKIYQKRYTLEPSVKEGVYSGERIKISQVPFGKVTPLMIPLYESTYLMFCNYREWGLDSRDPARVFYFSNIPFSIVKPEARVFPF